ncbi:hypothetical protein [Novosphingobium sp.]|uniref:hypothetical protein n=1 Tax=Novosphingobium sp. TaxID=1874826 RepID=UPI0026337B52|nr:hypothetical protein [Novosphingobium sp.]
MANDRRPRDVPAQDYCQPFIADCFISARDVFARSRNERDSLFSLKSRIDLIGKALRHPVSLTHL